MKKRKNKNTRTRRRKNGWSEEAIVAMDTAEMT